MDCSSPVRWRISIGTELRVLIAGMAQQWKQCVQWTVVALMSFANDFFRHIIAQNIARIDRAHLCLTDRSAGRLILKAHLVLPQPVRNCLLLPRQRKQTVGRRGIARLPFTQVTQKPVVIHPLRSPDRFQPDNQISIVRPRGLQS